MARRRGPAYLKPFRRTRNTCYRVARVMGNVQPWLELDVRKIIRRCVYRQVGKRIVAPFFGGRGPLGRIVRSLIGR